ncbi:MAG TPA: peptide deformylase [Acidimicrobiia bacterium]|jgi:peptide deformylase|nr:peptide deformylase [Acidimicrobiia bacterium]
MATFPIRVFGDLGLKQRCPDVTEFDGALARLADDMIETMYAAPGVGLAANQIGIQKRIFVYDAGDGPFTVINPTIVESSEAWEYEEGCLSVPGMYFPISRPRCVTLQGFDLEGKQFAREGQDLLGRIFLHETDHLDGFLLLDRLEPDLRKEAMRHLRSGVAGSGVRRFGTPDGSADPPTPE